MQYASIPSKNQVSSYLDGLTSGLQRKDWVTLTQARTKVGRTIHGAYHDECSGAALIRYDDDTIFKFHSHEVYN